MDLQDERPPASTGRQIRNIVIVFFLYLNYNFGGQKAFSEYDTVVQPKAGRLLMFPPTWTYLHTGHKPLETPKYIIGSYLHYV